MGACCTTWQRRACEPLPSAPTIGAAQCSGRMLDALSGWAAVEAEERGRPAATGCSSERAARAAAAAPTPKGGERGRRTASERTSGTGRGMLRSSEGRQPHHPSAARFAPSGGRRKAPGVPKTPAAPILDIRTLFRHADIMDIERLKQYGDIHHYAKVYTYPCGVVDILCSSKPMFTEAGWEAANDWALPPKPAEGEKPKREKQQQPEDIARSMRRARARVRRLALSNDFRWFVTLTLDQTKVDRYDMTVIQRKLNNWCSNQVKRKGLAYILVPERHKDGAIHFHGFFNDALEAVASGHRDKNGHMIFNLPGWSLGFTAAIEVYGDYAGAVAYVCKYIGKQGDKPSGRWYYSGGDLREPAAVYGEISPTELMEQYGERVFAFEVPGALMAVANGLRPGQDEPEGEDWEQIGMEVDNIG